MRYEILDGQTVINTIVADAEFMAANYPQGNYREVVAPELPLVAQDRHLAPASFKRRLTQPERIGIRQAAKVSDEVYDFMDLLDTSKFIDLDDPLTQYGLQQLEAAGLLAAGRAAEILTAPVQESERP